MADSVSSYTKEILRNAERTITVDEIVDQLVDIFRDQWTEEENLRYRLGNYVRQCANSKDWYSVLRNTYANFQKADDKTKEIILENQKEKLAAVIQAYCRKRQISGQLTFRFYDDGSYEIVETWAS